MKIFFCHPTTLKPLLKKLRGKLPPFLEPWIDEDRLLWGEDLQESLRDAIRNQSNFVIIFLDQDALSSEWVRRELKWALGREGKGRAFVLPILVDTVIEKSLPVSIRNRLQLRVKAKSGPSVSALAEEIQRRLFQLVVAQFEQQDAALAHTAGNLAAILSAKMYSGHNVAERWKGYIIQEKAAPNTPRIISTTMSLQRKSTSYVGELHYRLPSSDEMNTLDVCLIPMVERTLVGNYVNRRPEATHYGSVMLQLDFDGAKCDGGYMGIGNVQKAFTRGRFLFTSSAGDPAIIFGKELKAYEEAPDIVGEQ